MEVPSSQATTVSLKVNQHNRREGEEVRGSWKRGQGKNGRKKEDREEGERKDRRREVLLVLKVEFLSSGGWETKPTEAVLDVTSTILRFYLFTFKDLFLFMYK